MPLWLSELRQGIPRNFPEFICELSYLAEKKLALKPPFYMRRAISRFPENKRKECEILYRLCYDAQNGRFNDEDWVPPLTFSKLMLKRRMYEQYIAYLRKNAWFLVPDAKPKEFKTLRSGMEAQQTTRDMEDEHIQPSLLKCCNFF